MALASWTQQQILDQLISGYSWSGSTITYAFPTASSGMYGGNNELPGFVGLNAVQQAASERALQTWDDLIAPDLVRTTAGNSNIEIGTSSTGVSYAHAYYPSVGSVWFNRAYADLMSPQIGQYSFQVYVHELGHAFGLDHMGAYNGSGNWTPSSFEDSQVYSVMSYFGPNTGRGSSSQIAWADWVGRDGRTYSPQTPMLNDVLAIQTIYGAETTTRTGDTVYGFGSNVSGSMAAIFDFALNANPILTIYDAGGIDTLNLSGWDTNCTINLAPGSFSSGNSMTNNIAIAYSCSIENAVGGSAADQITGNALANRLDGGAGNDSLFGGVGDDVLIASLGDDLLDGGDGSDSVVFAGAYGSYTYTYSENVGFNFYSTVSGSDTVREMEIFVFADGSKSVSELLGGASMRSLVSISSNVAQQLEAHSGSTVFTYRLSLNTASSSEQTLNWSLQGTGTSAADVATDFVGPTSGSITFAIGETERTIAIAVKGDRVVEANESFVVTLSNPSSGLGFRTSSATGIILNDDAANSDDYGATPATAGAMTVGGGPLTGWLERSTDSDLFAVSLSAGTTYVFDLQAPGSAVDAYLSLHGPTTTTSLSSAIASNDNAAAGTSSAQIIHAVTTTGTYYLLARDARGGSGSYTLQAATFAGRTMTGDASGNQLTGTPGNDELYGLGGADSLAGDAGNDHLDGGTGADVMSGGAGNDSYVVDNIADVVSEGSASGGNDRVYSSVSFALGNHLEELVLTGEASINATGNILANRLTGNSGSNVLDGQAGIDTFAGGLGDDTYVLDAAAELANVSEGANGGNDTLRLVFASSAPQTISLTGALANFENVELRGNGPFSVIGNGAANLLSGNAQSNRLEGAAGNDTLDGQGGADQLVGGDGDDLYLVDHIGDVLSEAANAGTDSVRVAINTNGATFVLAANIENATVVGSAANNLSGNDLANVLTGNALANRLDGGAGVDTLTGGSGGDTYVVDHAADTIIETSTLASEIDTVVSSVNWTLAANLENLSLLGSADLVAGGNSLNNLLTGNSGANRLDGGAGADTMFGGAGNDTYVVDSAADVVYETASASSRVDAGGTDTVESSVSWTLGNFVENLLLGGSGNLGATGNALANTLRGNAGNNLLDGKAGIDVLDGGEGSDIYLIGLASDHPAAEIADGGTSGIDEVRFAATVASTLTLFAGDVGIERVVIGSGLGEVANSSGTGALNIDAALVGNALSIVGNAGANVLTGTAYADHIDGGAGADRLIGAGGSDTLIGGAGNDVYVTDASDSVIETSTLASEIDTIETSSSWTLGANLENLRLLGSANLAGTGNALNNVLTGNGGANLLDGGLGADTMFGGAGDDIYVVDNLADKVFETATASSPVDSGGSDTVRSSVSWTLGNFVENLVLEGSGNLGATGNALANTLRGNAGNNLLDGKAGIDVLDGGEGSDLYLIAAASDHPAAEIADSGTSGIDEVRFAATAASTLTLFAGDSGIERVVIGSGLGEVAASSGTVALNVDAALVGNSLSIVGNAGANVLTGTTNADTISGSGGADRLIGGGGNDRLIGGTGNDSLTGGAGADRFVLDQAPSATANRDLLTDFMPNSDTIELSLAVFRALGTIPGSLGANQFWSGAGVTRAHDADDRIIYNTTTGDLYYDADGSGSAAAVAIALVGVDAHPQLGHADFALIA
ncbi:MAG TPA: M10 family metallopeptidase C-terminal domain-containing protein [Candidatus Accumulibacter phosphatis]|nr:M10 family metallopeptidase C-terminal domain-containing protein [Candidatus Accumulibacter phosphatis]HRQ94398.1 M10 family metallopeptidase C-terminal domain-containing protein [Candidatus Accumulibacter phosphatis]